MLFYLILITFIYFIQVVLSDVSNRQYNIFHYHKIRAKTQSKSCLESSDKVLFGERFRYLETLNQEMMK